MSIFNLVLFWVFFGFLASYIARRKERNPKLWFLLGLSLGLIGVIIVILLPKKTFPVVQQKVIQPKEITPQVWHTFDRNNKEEGPFTIDELVERWKNKDLNENTYMWTQGMDHWKHLKDLPETMCTVSKEDSTS